ncbi:interferon alpha/beta receptor 2 isoform X2 [Hippopotamus amphibius kiboko]|uniref:interferon alpha/beta receptor 2 isoform X2 n=1 Tax=Hippopotamus amphibius kiboko TaxID=575201 RepID=UPI00259AB031|nr:interferon alpha/beta receptor 2 isoform X2 [Hippopotamus amphibius kiboko]
MLLSQNVSAIGPLSLYPMVVPTHYTLWYTITSKQEDMKIVGDCTNITRSFCDLTDVWVNLPEMYIPKVVGFRGNRALVSCMGSFFLTTDALYLDPPEFEIVDFTDHINVTVKFQSVPLKMLNAEELQFYLEFIEEQSGGIVKKHKPKINGNITENFNYVIDKLIPNTNYCVSVYFEPKEPRKINRSPLKCALFKLGRESELSESATIGGVVTLFLITVAFISTLVMLKRIGYICLRSNFPKVLNFYKWSVWVFPGLPPLEKVAAVEVIHINRKKKVWNYDYDDESDSDKEAAPQESEGGYTKHGLTGRLCPTSTSLATLEDCSDPAAEAPDLPEPEADPEAPTAPGPGPWQSECTSGDYQGRGNLLQDPVSKEESSSTEESGDRILFNVDLNSVCIRALEDDDDSEVPRMLPSHPEETVVLENPDEAESSLLVASGEGTQLPFPGPSAESPWPEDNSSDKSDSSESDVDIGDGYVMR